MPRNYRAETEFGLPVLPRPDGSAILEGVASKLTNVTALTDAEAIANDGNVGSLSTTGYELREIYAQGEGGLLGPQEPKAGTQ